MNGATPQAVAARLTKLVISLVAISVVPICAEAAVAARDNETRALFTECAAVYMLVEEPNEPAKRIGLTKQAIQNAAEARLRSARLYEDEFMNQFLYVQVLVVRNASGINVFSIQVSLKRHAEDVGYGLPAFVAVWDTGTVGTSSDAQFILRLLSS